ncbi:MAG: hypothetical protein NUV87_02960 [Candidatus Roizmanbacteria bacterium]|nr:hypothetical protein [Candidatus Roizmanbacteria bacterium]MCR4313380.1 hypothetical protein [Candidatus Roizmanbacteria bacterium]
MNVFTFLSYVNKVSLIAFFVTTLIVGYQIYILRKEKGKEQAPTIPDFKEGGTLGMVSNFTSLPSSLTKKELKAVNYSKMIFPIITAFTVIIIVFVVSLIGKNGSPDQALVTPSPIVTRTPIEKSASPTPKQVISPPGSFFPTKEASPSPIVEASVEASPSAKPTVEPTGSFQALLTASTSPTVVPTEIILAQAPSLTPTTNPSNITPTTGAIKVLPETGSLEKGLLIIGVALSTIFFSFWF